MTSTNNNDMLKFTLPSTGFLFEEDVSQYVLCKPILLPVKTVALEKLEKMQKEAEEKFKNRQNGKSEN